MPEISVVIPVFNIIPRKQFLLPTLRSVYRQTIAHQLKVYLVDDGSSDGTPEYVQTLPQSEFPGMQIMLLEKNVGKHQLLNTVVGQHVKTPYFVILDSDDLLLPTAIEKMWQMMQANPKLTSVKPGQAVLSDGQIKVKSIVPQNPAFYRYYIHNFGAFIGNTGSMWRSDVFRKTIRPFDPQTEIGKMARLTCEDGLRLYLLDPSDWNFDAINEPLLIYRMHNLQWTADKPNMHRCDDFLEKLFRSSLDLKHYLIERRAIFDPANRYAVNKHVYNHVLANLILLWKRGKRGLFIKEAKLFFSGIPDMPGLYYLVFFQAILLLLRYQDLPGYVIFSKLRWWFPKLLMAEVKLNGSERQMLEKFAADLE